MLPVAVALCVCVCVDQRGSPSLDMEIPNYPMRAAERSKVKLSDLWPVSLCSRRLVCIDHRRAAQLPAYKCIQHY